MNTVPKTGFLDVPGARLHYEVRGAGPLVVLVGAPMDARGFEGLADLLAVDHTVLTTDPRGIFRSVVEDRSLECPPDLRADDLSRLIAHVDAGPAVLFGSSGGAVSVLALAQAHPEQLSMVIAHEPPLNGLLADREEIFAAADDVARTHLSGDVVGGWRRFLALANIEMPEEVFQMYFGGERDAQAKADEDYQYRAMFGPSIRFRPDVERLKSIGVPVVVGIGDESGGQLCERTSEALAALLGVEPTRFAGGHTGFADDAARFEPGVREVLARL
ncbi:alpha/beta hydrolase [Phytomonospora sp. NPDC050363]|uniref:alpha/beta fold hydrolase n=1 Tax=Phytomonospora sp. NPDC050363 TaxID=3155642 RepID=UPI0033F1387A